MRTSIRITLSRAVIAPLTFGFVMALPLTLLATSATSAQEFRVMTRVSRYFPEEQNWTLVSRSLTLFHAGKVYDKVEEVGEVVIYEPHQNQFVILSENQIGCLVRSEELLQFLKVARTETLSYVNELRTHKNQMSHESADALAFQLDPTFENHFDAQTGRLRLVSHQVGYDVATESDVRGAVVEQYLNYADWAGRLNHVLHPHSLYPASRLALNKALREQQRLPTEVTLRISMPGETQMRAEHRFEWRLQAFDKTDIRKWEALLQSDEVRWLGFREYQRELLNRLAADRR